MFGKGQFCCGEQSKMPRVKPAECTPEQIWECHGDSGIHPCSKREHPCQAEQIPQAQPSRERNA